MKKITTPPILYLGIILGLLGIFQVIDISRAFNNPSGNPPAGFGGIGVATGTAANALYIDASGRVGVGTVSPSYPLTISSSTDSLFGLYRSGASYPTIFKVGTDSAFVVNNNNSDTLTIKSGNIGIGTTTPASKLSIVGGGISVDGVPQVGRWNSRVAIGNTLTTADNPNVGLYTSLAIGWDGLPVIAYRDTVNSDLKVVKCGNLLCSSGNTITTVDSTGSLANYTSIAIGADGYPVISYLDITNSDLKVAKCGNAACSSGNTITTIDSTGSVGAQNSIIIGTDGLPIISYYDATNTDLKVIKCGNAACSSGNTITTVDATGDVGTWTSIAMSADGFPVISYANASSSVLKVAKCGNAACSSGTTVSTVDASVGEHTSMTIGNDNLPVIAYFDSVGAKIMIAKCGNAACSSGNSTTTLDSFGGLPTSLYPSIAIGQDGLPIVAYFDDVNNDLKVAKCGNVACTFGNAITAIDTSGTVGEYASLAIGADGLPIISYHDGGNITLKVAHCGSENCIPYWTRR